MQSVGFAEDAAGFVAVTNECSDCVAALEKTADDFAATWPVAPITAVVILSPFGTSAAT